MKRWFGGRRNQRTEQPPTSPPAPTPQVTTFTSTASSSRMGGAAVGGGGDGGGGGATLGALLLECARAMAGRDNQRAHQLMCMINELASPSGDVEQKVASYFLQGLLAREAATGPRTLRTLMAAADRSTSFDMIRRTMLRFQELSPWSSFGHAAANGAILESFLEVASTSPAPQRFHILDLSNTFCTQWPTFLEALATRSASLYYRPHLSITVVVSAAPSAPAAGTVQHAMREIEKRMVKHARLMGVPFSIRVVHHAGDLAFLDLDALDLYDGGATTVLAVNCINSLRGVLPGNARRDAFITSLRRIGPRVVTVVEEEADLVATEGKSEKRTFVKVFREGLRFFSAYMDSLEESFPRTSNERLALEKAAGRAILDLVSCPASESVERRETAASWARRMWSAGFSSVAFSQDGEMQYLLQHYREGWSMHEAAGAGAGVFLAWKEQPVVWASAWRP